MAIVDPATDAVRLLESDPHQELYLLVIDDIDILERALLIVITAIILDRDSFERYDRRRTPPLLMRATN